MKLLFTIRDICSRFYGKHDTSIRVIMKFLMAAAAFSSVNHALGQMTVLNHPLIVLVLAAVCAFLPSNSCVLIATVMILLHFYAISLEAALAGGGILLIMMLLYFSIAPHSAMPLIIGAIASGLGIGAAPAVFFGLTGGPLCAVGIGTGALTCGLIRIVSTLGGSLEANSKDAAEAIVQKMTVLINAFISNKEMFFSAVILMLLLWIVWAIRRAEIKYAWMLAAATGLILYTGMQFAGILFTGSLPELIQIVKELLVSLAAAWISQTLLFSLDYRKTENIRFEDDEYYYYVKAIPKRRTVRKRRPRRSERR